MTNNELNVLVRLGVIGKDDVKAVGDLMKEAGASTAGAGEKAEVSHGQFRRLAHVMGSEIPGASTLMEAGFSAAAEPMMASTFLLVAGIEMFKHALEKLNQEKEQAKQSGEALADLDNQHTKVIEKQQDALEQANVASATYYHNLIRNTRDSIGELSKLAGELLKVQAASVGDQADARKSIAEQEIDSMEQRGVIAHQTAVQMKLQVDEAYHRQKILLMMAEEQVRLQIDQGEISARAAQTQGLAGQVQTAEGKYRGALTAKTANDTRMDEAQGRISGAQDIIKGLRSQGVTEENIEKLREGYEQAGGKSGASLSEMFTYLSRRPGGMVPRQLFGSQGDVLLAQYEGAQKDIELGNLDLKQGRANRTTLDTNAETAKADLDAARDELKKNRQEIQDLQTKIASEQRTNKLNDSGAFAGLGLESASGQLTGARGIADRLAGGGQATSAEQQQLMRIASQIAGHSVDLKTAVQIIENGANNINTFMAQVSRLAGALNKFTPADQANLQKQIDEIVARMNAQP